MEPHVINNKVDLALFEDGSFSPVNWLLREGRLDYQDYQNWKKGDSGYLEDHFNVPIADIIADLKLVQTYAASLKLESSINDYRSLSGSALGFCRSSAHEQLLNTIYEPARNRVQMDLFMDSAPTCAGNDLANAIISDRKQDVPRLLSRLKKLDLNKHRQFEHLLSLKKQLISEGESVADKINLLSNDVTPLAFSLFGRNTQDFIVPCWQRLTEQLEGQQFDAEKSDIHASFTAFKGYQWLEVLSSVKREQDWTGQPQLIFRVAEACFKLTREQEGLENWFRLFFKFPEIAAQLIGQTGHGLLLSDWRIFIDLDSMLASDLFPAWLLLKKPGLATLAKTFERQGLVNEPFQTIAHLENKRTGGIDSFSIEHRTRLQQKYPDLFELYMRAIANR